MDPEIRRYSDSLLLKVHTYGVNVQLDRYLKATRQRKHSKPSQVLMQLHEISSLLEDLDCARRIANRLYGYTGHLDMLIQSARDTLRHDLRDELANENDRKRMQARRLRLDVDIRHVAFFLFNKDHFKVGGTEFSIKELKDYIDEIDKLNKDFKELLSS